MVHNNSTQVAAFEKLLGICNDLGARYNPGNASLMPSALDALLEQAQQNAKAETDAHANYTLAVNARKEAFEALQVFVVRMMRAVKAHRVSSEDLRDLDALKRRITGLKKNPKPPDDVKTDAAQESPPKTSSGAFRTYDAIVETYARMIVIITKMPEFTPKESELTPESLTAKLEDLKAKSRTVAAMDRLWSKARIIRNESFFGDNGITAVSKQVKEYVRFVTGVQSPIASKASKIRFKSKNLR